MLSREDVEQIKRDWNATLAIDAAVITELCDTCLTLFAENKRLKDAWTRAVLRAERQRREAGDAGERAG